ncbi:hypothetical protein [Mucilaginibacter arboris]|uniref:Lipocalin-like domain-containing protein n=1 Tax=Mucilaginibacter arboris TaxID=2682090 RepID=A0A7K1SW16_9SPHI|nr:hypothetical protein [Mucilaginibacter arboris]MVN21516.1 hypothetical protein [Mucilaginibacter arboris]
MTRNSKLLLLLILLIAVFAVNSCKKDEQSSISDFLTRSTWNLALLQRFKYVNEALVKTDTIQAGCTLNQTLLFNADNTYNFNNYSCKTGLLSSTWSFTPDMLYLNLNSVISQTSPTFSSKQNVARIINLGQYSLSFDAGDVNIVHKPTDTVVIYRYGFIHSK